MYKVPILYIVFNRPEETRLSLDAIRAIKPLKLYISQDGSRAEHPDDVERIEKVKKVIKSIDWECDVKYLIHENNLGCRLAPEKALEWFFKNEKEGIIIEDDIIPNKAFFEFMEVMLERYRDNKNIFSINGCSLGYTNSKANYGKTRYFNMWGWATWKRSFDLVQKTWPLYKPELFHNDKKLLKSLKLPVIGDGNKRWQAKWNNLFASVYNFNDDVWDYQWSYTVLKTDSYCIRPSQNYVQNIGVGEMATHHKFTNSPIHRIKYTSETFIEKTSDFVPKIDPDYEIFWAAGRVHNIYFKSFRPIFIKKVIKSKLYSIRSIIVR